MRHGDAERHAESDERRPLSEFGMQQVKDQAEKLAERGLAPARVIASPLLRAQQTATLVTSAIGYAGNIETNALISPDGNPQKVLDELIGPMLDRADLDASGQVAQNLLVTHQPFVSGLVIFLTGAKVFLDTANVVSIDLSFPVAKSGEIRWFL